MVSSTNCELIMDSNLFPWATSLLQRLAFVALLVSASFVMKTSLAYLSAPLLVFAVLAMLHGSQPQRAQTGT